MDRNQALALAVVLLTALAVFLLGWESGAQWRDRQDRRQLPGGQADDADRPVPWPTYAGWVQGSSWAEWRGAADPAFEAPQADPMAMAAAGYRLGQDRAAADDVHREAEAIWADVQLHPELWRHR